MKKKHLLAGIAFTALLAGSATAADMPWIAAPPVPAPFSWTGGYIGITAGGAWGAYNTTTSTALTPGGYFPKAATVAAVNAAGPQSINPGGFATGIEAGYNWQSGALVLGVEADLQALHLSGAANGGAVPYPPGFQQQFVVSSYADSTWLVTARARVGLVANNWLFYATGGLAVTQLTSDLLFTDSGGALEEGRIDTVKAGYVVGGGVEAPLTERLSVKAEYLYVRFNDATVSGSLPPPASQTFTHSADLAANIVRVGLNYRFVGVDPRPAAAVMPVKATLLSKAPPPVGSDWEVETGARLWLSTGTIGAPQPLLNSPDILASRLTYKDLDAISGETFARVDHASGWFAKGFLGAGRITDGNMYDEDFPAFFAYSNTVQSNNSGSIGYANIDLGYTFLRAPGAKVGAFAGYNYYRQHVNTYGCAQLAGDAVCVPASLVPANFIGIAEDDRFNSLRLGLSAQFMLTDRLKLTADVAYLPLVDFSGQDDHNARELLLPEASSNGNGVMLEAVLGYAITEAWNVGVGGRYWAWNMRTGTETFNFLGSSDPPLVEPARFNSERYGVFVQTSYKWGDTTPAAAGAHMPTKAPVAAAAPMNWTGFYIGAHLGGGWSNDRWSDPFGSTPASGGYFNVAGFGDATHATGPLGGGQIGYNLQSGQWVLGVEANASATDLRGENTCFSGLVGLNCQRIVGSLGTVAGRLGYAWGRSLAYVKGGGAWTSSTYNLNGNTSVLALGTGSTGATAWGWTAGGGIEYALTNNWTARIEYDHIEVPGTTVPFPSVALVNAQNISIRQWIDVVKLGVNYKFDWNPLAANL